MTLERWLPRMRSPTGEHGAAEPENWRQAFQAAADSATDEALAWWSWNRGWLLHRPTQLREAGYSRRNVAPHTRRGDSRHHYEGMLGPSKRGGPAMSQQDSVVTGWRSHLRQRTVTPHVAVSANRPGDHVYNSNGHTVDPVIWALLGTGKPVTLTSSSPDDLSWLSFDPAE